MYSATTISTMILAILVMVALSPSLTLWVLLPAPVVAVAVWFFGKTIHDLYEKIQAALATLPPRPGKSCRRALVRAYAQEEAEIRGFDEPTASMSPATSNSSAPGACSCLRFRRSSAQHF